MGDEDQKYEANVFEQGHLSSTEKIMKDFFHYMKQEGYAPRQVGKIKFGMKHLRTFTAIEKLIPNLACQKFLKQLGDDLRSTFSTDIAKNALTCARRLRDFALDEGLIEKSFTPRTNALFAEIEVGLNRSLVEEERLNSDYRKIIFKEYFHFANYLEKNGQFDFAKVNHETVFRFLGSRNPCLSGVYAIRKVLRYLYRESYLLADFSALVISGRNKNNEVRKFLPSSDTDKLLEAIDTSTIEGKRALVFFLLMARLCLRGKEILRLKIEDIDWDAAEIFVNGKHDRETSVFLTNEISDALLDYLRCAKRLYDPHLVLSLKPPYSVLTSVYRFNEQLHKMYEGSGVERPTTNVTIQVFRHSKATEKLNNGESIEEVKDFMRHEDVATTMIYAKYNLASLRSLAREWPETSS